jgi:hypothetical protein
MSGGSRCQAATGNGCEICGELHDCEPIAVNWENEWLKSSKERHFLQQQHAAVK